MVSSPEANDVIEWLRHEIAALVAKNAAPRQQIPDPRPRLGKDGSNGGRPPLG